MLNSTNDKLIERGLEVAESQIFRQNKIWARHTDEKADVAASLMKTIRTLHKAAPREKELSALAIGSADEPQFRLLEAAFKKGLWLYDIDGTALAIVAERLQRQMIEGVSLVSGDYTVDLADPQTAMRTLSSKLGGRPFDLVTLHHCLYYSSAAIWPVLVEALYDRVLAPGGAMHFALMSARETREGTTTRLYHHFSRMFFGAQTNQDLLLLKDELKVHPVFRKADISSETHEVTFWVDDFEKYMAVVWMVMLYPHGHRYTLDQRTQIIEFVIENFWRPRRPLIQAQDYLTVFKSE
ncbi:class I SAM-dependent methyltransferase [Hoeflea sp. TYP-13]|uniref:class I SAM-dependent methyltransferase n=1 Tax=Hoeflea sp. TYP-13 TaxID=3230023 RepID=UPI0034C5CD3A